MNWISDLLGAQVEVNRAVFFMNVHFVGGISDAKKHLTGKSLEPSIVLKHINLAIQDLEKARTGFDETQHR